MDAGDETLQAESDGTSVPADPVAVIRREEQVTITKRVGPVERVTLVKRSVIVDEDVALEGRTEQVDVSRHAAASGFREGLPEKVL